MSPVRRPVALGTVAVLVLGGLSAAYGSADTNGTDVLGGPVVLAVRPQPALRVSVVRLPPAAAPAVAAPGLAVPAAARRTVTAPAVSAGTAAAPAVSVSAALLVPAEAGAGPKAVRVREAQPRRVKTGKHSRADHRSRTGARINAHSDADQAVLADGPDVAPGAQAPSGAPLGMLAAFTVQADDVEAQDTVERADAAPVHAAVTTSIETRRTPADDTPKPIGRSRADAAHTRRLANPERGATGTRPETHRTETRLQVSRDAGQTAVQRGAAKHSSGAASSGTHSPAKHSSGASSSGALNPGSHRSAASSSAASSSAASSSAASPSAASPTGAHSPAKHSSGKHASAAPGAGSHGPRG